MCLFVYRGLASIVLGPNEGFTDNRIYVKNKDKTVTIATSGVTAHPHLLIHNAFSCDIYYVYIGSQITHRPLGQLKYTHRIYHYHQFG